MTQAATDATIAIASDERLSPTAVRLYLLLRDGWTVEAAATVLKRSPEWLRRYERQLRTLGYLEIHEIQDSRGRHRHYVFPSRESRLASAS